MQIRKLISTTAVGASLALAACGDNNEPGNNVNNANNENNTSNQTNNTTNNATNNPTNNATNNPTNNTNNTNNMTAGPAMFTVTVQNNSDASWLPTPISPGVWALQADPLFAAGETASEGLASLAEDGDGSGFATEAGAETFDDPAPPGMSTSWTFEASPDDAGFQWAAMYVQTNDVLVGTVDPVALFDADGMPIASQELTLGYWDAGSETDEAPGQGPNQAPRQAAADTGAAEAVIRPFSDTTRALPGASALVNVTVTEAGGTFTVGVENTSAAGRLLETPIAPVFWATHDDTFSVFTAGEAASAGLETLAEDGSPADLVAAHDGAAGTLAVGAATMPDGGAGGPAMPGQAFTFDVTPDATNRYLSIAAMVVQSNDAFLAFTGGGVALLDENGDARDPGDIAADITTRLAVWDAGTEANEVPGVGANQAPRQAAANTGPDDPEATVRLYADATNDLAGAFAGGFLDVTITNSSTLNEFIVTITNTSDTTVYPGVVTPTVWAVHTDAFTAFEEGTTASAELEQLAEDGVAAPLEGVYAASGDVVDSGIAATPQGAAMPGPLTPGDAYQFAIDADQTNRWFSAVSMIVPSNDTFWALRGVELVDMDGNPRSDADIATDVEAMLTAYDAGTELNQAGAGGVDQAPRQANAGDGDAEGDGMVRDASTSLWPIADPNALFTVTIEAM